MTLIEQIRELYSKYTGEEIAAAIGQYRKEIEEIKQLAEIDLKIEELTEKRRKIRAKPNET